MRHQSVLLAAVVRVLGLTLVMSLACSRIDADPTRDLSDMSSPVSASIDADADHLIALNGYPIDTRDPERTYSKLPAEVRRSDLSDAMLRGGTPAGGLYLVQLQGAVKDETLEAIRATGVELVSYVPYNAYVVRASSTAAAALIAAKVPGVQFMGDYEPGFRLSPELRRDARGTLSERIDVTVQVVDGPTARSTMDALAHLAISVHATSRVGNFHNVRMAIRSSQLDAIASMPDVFAVEPRTQRRLLDEAQGQIVAGNLSGGLASGPGYLSWLDTAGFNSSQFSSFSVEVADDAYSLNGHPDLPNSRIAFQTNPSSQSGLQGGHGFLNSHIIGGFNNGTGTAVEDSRGFNYGLGITPWARVGITAIFGPVFVTPTTWESTAYGLGARISSNSWDFTSTYRYDVNAQEVDRVVRDAQGGSAGNQQMIVVFAAGNDGSAPNTVLSPATAKNVLTAGASENDRQTGADGCQVANAGADNANDIIPFSSRGPVNAAGGDGRWKPDLMAPGTHVEAGVPQSNYDGSSVCNQYWPTGQTLYGWSSGTSHSCPAISGGAALVYQDFMNEGRPAPSPAMAKAVLMNSATYMTGAGANDTLPSNNQGMGRMNLSRAFDSTPRVLVDQTQVLGTSGQTYQLSGTISTTAQPFRVTLAWTDAPGPTTGAPWVNNLDLEVIVNGTFYRGNVFSGASSIASGAAADTRNNVESVFLPAGTSGNFVVTVRAANIAGDGVPGNADPTDQDFALVIYNGSQPTIGASPSSFTFNANAGGANPASQTLSITNTGTGSLTWSVSSNASWLTVNPSSGTAPSSLAVSASIAGLSVGSYSGALTISSAGATNSPVIVPVTLSIADVTPPSVTITAPAQGASVKGTVTVTATASDNAGVTEVRFWVDGAPLPSDSSPPYSTAWDTSGFSEALHHITARSYDAANNVSAVSDVAVTVDRTPPTCTITAPTAGPVDGTVAVNATATDNVGVTRVEFYLDGVRLLGSDPTPPYGVNWDTTTALAGSHVLTCKAYDAANNLGASAGVTVTVPDKTPPTCAITLPVFGAIVPGTMTVNATATDNVGVSRVEFYMDLTQPIGTASASPYSISWVTPAGTQGNHVLTCTAYDAAGNPGMSTGVLVTIDPTAPTCTITSPAAGAGLSGTATVNATATDNIGVTRVEFYLDGAPILGNDYSSPWGIAWDTTTASPGSHVLTCKAYDEAGNSGISTGVTVTALDQVRPTCTLTAPAAGASLSGTVVVSATATDNVGVTRVDFAVDGTQVIGTDSAAPYSINWDTTVSPGSHQLTCTAYDAAGNSGTSAPRTVTVLDVTPPTCAITAPTAGSTVAGTVTISASASDNAGVTRVDFYADGTLLLGSASTAPYSIAWSTLYFGSQSPGDHRLTCKAYDAAGNAGTSPEVIVNVQDQQAPDIWITAPVGGAPLSGTVTVSVSAWDNVGVTRVDYYLDGTQPIGTASASPFSINWDTTSTSPGNHALTARAFDAAGNNRTSVSVTETVLDQVPPTCAITAPTAGSTVTYVVMITASASDDVGVTRVEFYLDGTQLLSSSTTAPYGAAWDTGHLGYESPGNHVLTCKAYDAAGNVGTSPGVTVNVRDQQAPGVTITAPTDGATVSGTVAVSATVWDNVGVTRVDFYVDGTQLLGSDSTSPFSINWDTTTASLGSHVLKAKAFDAAGNNSTSSWVTVSVADQATPTVFITAPTAGATVSGTVTVSATASDNVGVVRVDCFLDGTLIGADSTAPYSINWATNGVPAGNHVLTCRAYDAAGNSATSAAVSVTVAPQLAISFTSPGIWQDVSGAWPMTVSVTANVGVAHVDYTVSPAFLEGGGDQGQFIGASASSPSFKVYWDTTQVLDGPYLLSATVYDVNGNSTTAQTEANVLNNPCGGGPVLSGLSSVICPYGLSY